MTILFDIGHPGHVHYFRTMIKQLKDHDHEVIVTARKRDIIFSLLTHFKIPFINRGSGKNTRLGKLIYMLKVDIHLLKICIRKKPDLFLSFSSPYAAQVAYLLRKPHIALNDTEHTDKMHSKFTYPFSSSIITPQTYQNQLGYKQIRFNNVVEGFYLHKNYYTPNPNIISFLNLGDYKKFILLRFVSWNAHHDYGQSGINIETKRALIKLLNQDYKVLISSEGVLDDEFKQYQINIPPERMHDVLYYASLFIGESGTMASESAFLGTPAIYINSLPLMCYLKLEQDLGLLKHFPSPIGVLDYVKKLIVNKNLKAEAQQKANNMKVNFIDPTAFLVWFIENYPQSIDVVEEIPDYQYKFR